MPPPPPLESVWWNYLPQILSILQVYIAKALLVTLLYRGITVWLTFVIGFYSFRKLQGLLSAKKIPPGSE